MNLPLGTSLRGRFPTYGFSGRGSCNEFSEGSIRSSITKVAARAKGKDVILTLEGRLEVNTPQVEGGMFHPECCVSRRWKRSLRRPHVAAPPERSPEGNFRAMAGVASFSKRLKVLAPLQNAGSDALVNAASPCQ